MNGYLCLFLFVCLCKSVCLLDWCSDCRPYRAYISGAQRPARGPHPVRDKSSCGPLCPAVPITKVTILELVLTLSLQRSLSQHQKARRKPSWILTFALIYRAYIGGVFALVWPQKGLRHRLVDLGRKRLCITAVYIINIFGSNIEQQFHRV